MSFGLLARRRLHYLAIQLYVDFKHTWWRLFHEHVVRTKLYIFFFLCDIFYTLDTACFLVCVWCALKQLIFCSFVFCRHRKQTPKTTKLDDGYAMKCQICFSNPAFMEENKNTLAYQLNSRNSMIPSVLRTKLKYYGNCFEDIKLSEEDKQNIDIPFGVYLTKQVNSKN